jgi:hypothetical protein
MRPDVAIIVIITNISQNTGVRRICEGERSRRQKGLQKNQQGESDLQLRQCDAEFGCERLGEQSPDVLRTGDRHHAQEAED